VFLLPITWQSCFMSDAASGTNQDHPDPYAIPNRS
jgi:hypothetical protein